MKSSVRARFIERVIVEGNLHVRPHFSAVIKLVYLRTQHLNNH
jgi:hypothetical protein